jgi:two-component system, chemotaxis family, protein-glutamate methylesterase/glutaminase
MATASSYRDIAVVGASGGGVEALQRLVAALPANYPGTLFVAIHVPPDAPSLLARILDHAGPLPARAAADGATFSHGEIWVAQPDRHLVIERGRMRLVHGPRENRHRPAIDVLFRSAAVTYGPRVVGVVLTGSLDDGSAGLWAIKMRGGVAIVQDPANALYPEMPQSALDTVEADHCLPLAQIPQQLVRLARERAMPAAAAASDCRMELEVTMAAQQSSNIEQLDRIGSPSSRARNAAVRCGRCRTRRPGSAATSDMPTR